ncbi:unnamed protein product [Brassica oleracea]
MFMIMFLGGLSLFRIIKIILSKIEAFIQYFSFNNIDTAPHILLIQQSYTLFIILIFGQCPSHLHHRICTENQNADSQLYNQKLQKLNFRLSQRLSGSKILYLDIYTPLIDMIKHPHSYGLEETLVGCCGTGLLEAGPLCKPLSRTCEDVSKYMFFDSVHPSQKAYSVIATYAFKKLFPLL